MWSPFHTRKPEVSPASLANLRRGTPPPSPAKAVQAEADALEATTKVTNSLFSFVDAFDKRINDKIAAMQPAGDDDGGEPGLMDLLAIVVPHIGPYIGPYVGPLLEKYAGVQPQSGAAAQTTPPTQTTSEAAPGGYDLAKLIPLAAQAPDKMLEVFMPKLREELAKQGIDEKQFKQACTKIGKVL